MLLVFGWKAIYGIILSILTALQPKIVDRSEEDIIMIIKNFVKEGSIDLDTFFNNLQYYTISATELRSVDSRICNAKLSDGIVQALSSYKSEFDVFATYDYSAQPVDLISKDSTDENRLITAPRSKKIELGSPNPINITSDEESDHIIIEYPTRIEETKFMIPNEGNINKSPMSLFTKATIVSIFCYVYLGKCVYK